MVVSWQWSMWPVSMKTTNAVTKVLYKIVHSNTGNIKAAYGLFIEYETLPKIVMPKYFKYPIISLKQRATNFNWKNNANRKRRFITLFLITSIRFTIYNYYYIYNQPFLCIFCSVCFLHRKRRTSVSYV